MRPYTRSRNKKHDAYQECTPWTDERLAKARKLAKEGLTAREIAFFMHTTRNSVIGANFRHGVGLLSKGRGVKRALEVKAQWQ
jgi:hypothetical protein